MQLPGGIDQVNPDAAPRAGRVPLPQSAREHILHRALQLGTGERLLQDAQGLALSHEGWIVLV